MYDQNPLLHKLSIEDLARPYEEAGTRKNSGRTNWRIGFISVAVIGAALIIGNVPVT